MIYGYVFTHETRNVADPSWLRNLAAHAGHGMVKVPYGTLDGAKELVRHEPRGYPAWPLRESLATVTLLQDFFANLRPPGVWTAFVVTMRSIEAMSDMCRKNVIPFSVLVLTQAPGVPWRYRGELVARGVDVIDECHLEIGPELSVPGEGHPNALAHARWAVCLAGALAEREPPTKPSS